METVQPVHAPSLSTLKGIQHGFFTRKGGVSKGIYEGLNAGLGSDDVRDDVIENRIRITNYLGSDNAKLASPYQVHSNLAVATTSAFTTERPQVDGIVTATPGVTLGIVTADCGPVLFADTTAGVIGACHAGWKGALTGVTESTIVEMEKLGAQRKNIIAALGPCITQMNYEVGPDFPAPFIEQHQSNERFFVPSQKPDHHMFDMVAYILSRLQINGVEAHATGDCTYAQEDNFYSYRRTTHRREPDYGRQLSAIVLDGS